MPVSIHPVSSFLYFTLSLLSVNLYHMISGNIYCSFESLARESRRTLFIVKTHLSSGTLLYRSDINSQNITTLTASINVNDRLETLAESVPRLVDGFVFLLGSGIEDQKMSIQHEREPANCFGNPAVYARCKVYGIVGHECFDAM